MQIFLYKNVSESTKLDKTLENAIELTGVLREGCEVSNPSVLVTGGNLATYNYMYIPEFNRYYFISDIVSVKNGLWQIGGHVDVLTSYKTQLRNLSAVVARQENTYNLNLNDPDWKVYANKQVLTRYFPSGFADTGTYYLTVVGGYGEQE